MLEPFLLPLLEGIAAGLVVAVLVFVFYIRIQRQAPPATLAAARTEAEPVVAEASAKATEARNQIVLEGKMESAPAAGGSGQGGAAAA